MCVLSDPAQQNANVVHMAGTIFIVATLICYMLIAVIMIVKREMTPQTDSEKLHIYAYVVFSII